MEETRTISVFGSRAPQPGSSDYETARKLGALLASADLAVATGGYGGMMSAVSQGAAEAGGHVIGVTCAQIERTRPAVPNRWVKQEIKYETLNERVHHLVRNNHGMVVLPGGIGTLSEFALAWSFLQVGELTPRPLILLGEMWTNWLETFVRPEYVLDQHLQLIRLAGSAETAAAAVTGAF
jgi:uncharacterized protein (TIGR00730 family)